MADSYLEGSTNPSKRQDTGLELAKDTQQINVPQGFTWGSWREQKLKTKQKDYDYEIILRCKV